MESLAHEKVTQVYKYLKKLNELRYPAKKDIAEHSWRLWFDDLPEYHTIEIGTHDSSIPAEEYGGSEVDEDDSELADSNESQFVLRVRRPELTPPPEPPEQLLPWLLTGWKQPAQDARVRVTLEESTEGGQKVERRFDDEPSRRSMLQGWTALREAWRKKELPAREAMEPYRRLFGLFSQIERESEQVELMIGDGLLDWAPESASLVRHPILLQRVDLQFDPEIAEFLVTESDRPCELYSSVLEHAGPRTIARIQADLEEGRWHPLDDEGTTAYFKRVVAGLSPEESPTLDSPESPKIIRGPVLFLRNRVLGAVAAVDAILEHLEASNEAPRIIAEMIGVQTATFSDDVDTAVGGAQSWNGEDEDILLAKEANEEQLRIAKRLETSSAVRVQGPPGTGKTHTIANLIGHLLAQGKSVLVTSHAAKALSVLRGQIEPALQPLCLTVGVPARDPQTGVESDLYGREQMKKAIEQIVSRLSSDDLRTLEEEAERLTARRHEVLRQLRDERKRLYDACNAEYEPFVVGGEQRTPSKAARKVAEGSDSHSWIPSPVTMGAPMPLSSAEIGELYASNSQISLADEGELSKTLPDPIELFDAATFEQMLVQRRTLLDSDLTSGHELWQDERPRGVTELEDLIGTLDRATDCIVEDEPWRLEVIEAGANGGAATSIWESLLAQIEELDSLATDAQEGLLSHDPITTEPMESDEETAQEIVEHLEAHEEIGRFALMAHGRWRSLIARCRTMSGRPDSRDEFQALLNRIRLARLRGQLAARWSLQVAGTKDQLGPDFLEKPERALRRYTSLIRQLLDWHQREWSVVHQSLKGQGFSFGAFWPLAGLSDRPPNFEHLGPDLNGRLLPATRAELGRRRLAAIEGKIASAIDYLETYRAQGDSGTVDKLRRALDRFDGGAYRDAAAALAKLVGLRTALSARHELLDKLERVAPAWAAAIRGRAGVHGHAEPPGNPAEAWDWLQLNQELNERSSVSVEDLQASIAQHVAELRKLTLELVEKKAWAHRKSRTSSQQQQALEGWKEAQKNIGRGTGKGAPYWRSVARERMSKCQGSVPVWIMPLNLVYENFRPGESRFDVLIIDEASQADVTTHAAMYLADKVLIVGDDQQVSPDAIGISDDVVRDLIATYLQGVPNAEFYNLQTSIYAKAGFTFRSSQMLKEHFRCVPEIIQFSNQHFYDGAIQPLRDPSDVIRRPFTIAHRVSGAHMEGSTGNQTNPEEAAAVASLLIACTEQPEYEGATFGVISLLGQAQASRIDELLHRHLSPEEYIRRRIRCGNSAQFQGDERDVMFLSVVSAREGEAKVRVTGDGARGSTRKRYNVAASRAGDQMWVVYSLDPDNDINPGVGTTDWRRPLIKHAQDPKAIERQLDVLEPQTESQFEKLVLQRLMQAGYAVIPQVRVGSYRIDLVAHSDGKKLAIECDGDRWHPPEKMGEDMRRQAILERVGWKFVRIRGSAFFRNPEAAMEPVFRRMAELGIRPAGLDSDQDVPTSDDDNELLARIRRRAAELARDWRATDPDEYLGRQSDPNRDKPTFGQEQTRAPLDPQDPAAQPAASTGAVTATSGAGVRVEGESEDPEPLVDQARASGIRFDAPRLSSTPNTIKGSRADPPETPRRADRPTLGREEIDPRADLAGYLEREGVEFLDLRSSRRQLWIFDGPDVSELISRLAARGIHFSLNISGRSYTNNRGGWSTHFE